jgi:hypothetical protein
MLSKHMREASISVVFTVLAILALCAALVLTLSAISCTNIQAFVWPSAVRCEAAPPVRIVVACDEVLRRDGLAGELSSDAVTTLEDIARDTSADSVVCALVQLREAYKNPPDGAPSLAYLARAARAQDFLDGHHIAIVKGAP